ncbi:hypothetical protein SBOR_7445 [Sclerotinia borealis F-4128]|uniref:Uncharacterized protein n=1 Tax=Sclerotinia borealis (strain F-4128) TaxID=1432307 RepID=W9C8R1_SCLBF|nr:hypothetical protein SBOR_7445 [Sclerotinia borealis F-4128]
MSPGGTLPEYIEMRLNVKYWQSLWQIASSRGAYEQVSMHAKYGGSARLEQLSERVSRAVDDEDDVPGKITFAASGVYLLLDPDVTSADMKSGQGQS